MGRSHQHQQLHRRLPASPGISGFRKKGEGGRQLLHTLNGTAILPAQRRHQCAVLENYQQQDGTVLVPARWAA